MTHSDENKKPLIVRFVNFFDDKHKESEEQMKGIKKDGGQRKASVQKFQYQLPSSFIEAVDNARLKAGSNILPQLHNKPKLSVPHRVVPASPSVQQHRKQHHHHRGKHHNGHPSSSVDHHSAPSSHDRSHHSNDRRLHQHQHHHHQKSLSLP